MMNVQLKKAIDYLAGNCDGASSVDGAGFNKLDTNFGHSLSELSYWSPKQEMAALRMVQKYAAQLKAIGINPAEIKIEQIDAPVNAVVTMKAPTAPVKKYVKRVGNAVALIAPYEPELLPEYRKIGKWMKPDGSIKAWQTTINNQKAVEVLDFAEKYGFAIDADTKKWLETFAETGRKEASEKAEKESAASKLSNALSSEVEVEGLHGTLRPFQKVAVEYARIHPRLLISDEMGCGKSIEAIAILQDKNAFPALVICPASIKYNWQREINKWLPDKLVSVANGGQPAKSADVIIINYDLIWREQYKWLEKFEWKGLVCDESHAIKEAKSKRSAAVFNKIGRSRAGIASVKSLETSILMTGTPVLNRPVELVHQLDALGMLTEFGGSFAFKNRYCDPKNDGWGWDFSGHSNEKELHEKLMRLGFLRRTKEMVLKELPPIQTSYVPITITNKEEYQRAEADTIAYIREMYGAGKANAAARAEVLVSINTLKMVAVDGKMTAMIDWIKDFLANGSKLVVFADHIKVQHELLKNFPHAAHVFGEDKDRMGQVDKFQKTDCNLMIASLKAGSEGLTMTAASSVVICEEPWSPSTVAQAASRCHRLGQKATSVNVYHMVGMNTIDETICRVLDEKSKTIDAVTDGKQGDDNVSMFDAIVKSFAFSE